MAESLARATTFLRANSFATVALDQYVLENHPEEADAMLDHTDTAIPVEVNFAICGMDRLAREVRRASRRRQREETNARLAAVSKLYAQLNTTITALLLSIELAIQTDTSPSLAFEKLDSIHQLVETLRQQLKMMNRQNKKNSPLLWFAMLPSQFVLKGGSNLSPQRLQISTQTICKPVFSIRSWEKERRL